MQDYEIRLHRADGALSIVMMTAAASDVDAREQAGSFLKEDIVDARIWCGSKLIALMHASGHSAKTVAFG